MATTTDLYELLGVSRDASSEEIKRAYRRRARELHPDANPDDPQAEARFKDLSSAYEVLSDPQKRRRYDQLGPEAFARGGGGGGGDPFGFAGGGLGDILDAFFGGGGGGGFGGRGGPSGPPRGSDLEVAVQLTFEQAVFGAQVPVEVRTAVVCETCEATGAAPGTRPETCSECGGAGQVRQVRQSILGQMVTAQTCGRCGGMGQSIADPCGDCRGEGRRIEERTYTTDIPPGVDSGSTLRLGGLGAAGVRGGGSGDLYVHVRVRPHERFDRSGDDLTEELHLTMAQAALGLELDYQTLEGTQSVDIPRGTQTGRVFRLKGHGVPHVQGRGRGDLLITVVVDTPTELNEDQEAVLRQLAEQRGEEVAPPDEGVLARLRSAFR